MFRPTDETRRDAEELEAELTIVRDKFLAKAKNFEIEAADLRGKAADLNEAISALHDVLDE